MRLVCEEARKARTAEKALQDAQLVETQKAGDLRLAKLKEVHELRKLELKAEQEKAYLEAKKEAAAREHELKIAGLGKHPPPDGASAMTL